MNGKIHRVPDACKFLNLLDPTGQFTFQTFVDKKDGPRYGNVLHGTFNEHIEELVRLNQAGAGIFVTINETNLAGRKATDIVRVRAHFIDSDDEPIQEVCQRFPLKPHMVVETSEGKGHAYFLVSDTPLEEFTQIQTRLIQLLGTDRSVKDLPRVMRLPGFLHMKRDPRLVQLVHVEEGLPPYTKEEILNALPPEEAGEQSRLPAKNVKADPTIPQSDGFRTETLTSLVGQLLAKGLENEDIFKWLLTWNAQNAPPLSEQKIWDTILSMRMTDRSNHPERYGLEMVYTDTGNARRLVTMFGEDIRYCHDRGEWMSWDGRRWLWDDTGEIVRRAKETAISIYRDASDRSKCFNVAEMDKASRWAKQSLNASGLRNMVTLAQSDLAVATTTDRLDRNDWVLNVSNGTIDLKDVNFRPHSRNDLNTKIAQVSYEPGLGCPTWLAFLDRVFGADHELISWMQRVVGYTLTGSTGEQVVFFLIGDGCNGKSTFLNTLKMMMGDYAVQAHPDSFMVGKYNSAGGARSDLMRLAGSRMAVASEGEEGQRLAEAFIKQVTGGEEISTRGLYQKNQVEFKPKFKLFFASNHKPTISGTDYGIWRRIRLIPFSVCIPAGERDPKLMDKLRLELPGILNWAYEGCIRWQEDGLSDIPAAVERVSQDYQRENDVIGRFIAERCGIGGKVGSSELYQAYIHWSQATGEEKKTQAQVSQYLMKDRKYTKERSKQGFFWKGLHVLTAEGEMTEVA